MKLKEPRHATDPKRTAQDRSAYMADYMRTRRANRVRNVVEARTPVANVARYFYNDAELRRHHLRDNSMGMWPERRHEFPESIEETLRRVRVR